MADRGDDAASEPGHPTDVVVIGAGIAGLAAARALEANGRSVVVLDEGATVGGRLATRDLAGARLDHGAQFFTQRGPEMAGLVRELEAAGTVDVWCCGFAEPDGHPRYVLHHGMRELARFLAEPLTDVRVATRVAALERIDDGWRAVTATGPVEGVAALLTAPVPQSLALLDAGGVQVDPGIRPALEAIDYDCAIAVMVVLDRPPELPTPGALQMADGPFSFVCDNRAKGLSDRPALTLHLSDRNSRRWWDADDGSVLRAALAGAASWLGDARVVDSQVTRWRYAAPRRVWPESCCVAVDGLEPLVLAGDAFDGPRVEGAYRSGLAAATALLRAHTAVG